MTGLALDHWSYLIQAFRRYLAMGYQEITVPWHARREAIDITLPPTARASVAEGGPQRFILVGSAEQALLDRALGGELPLGTPLVCMTPCFRLMDEGPLHHPYFAKVELGCFWSAGVGGPSWNEVERMAKKLQADAQLVHREELGVQPELGQPGSLHYGPRSVGLFVEIPMEDLEIGGVEVGSYGARSWDSGSRGARLTWVYGTGLAMPRAQEAIAALTKVVEAPAPSA